MKAGSMRGGGIRPLPPLGGRMGSSRGLGEARGAPPPLRGAQRDMSRDRCQISRVFHLGGFVSMATSVLFGIFTLVYFVTAGVQW